VNAAYTLHCRGEPRGFTMEVIGGVWKGRGLDALLMCGGLRVEGEAHRIFGRFWCILTSIKSLETVCMMTKYIGGDRKGLPTHQYCAMPLSAPSP